MTKRLLLTALICGLAACGGDDDPSKENNDNNTANNVVNNANNANNNANNNNSNNTTNNVVNNTTNNVANNTTNNVNNEVCGENIIYFGQVANSDDEHGGGVPGDPLTADAGLMQIRTELATFDETQDDFETNDIIEGSTPLETPVDVSGAVVTATMFGPLGNRVFWIEDGMTGMQVNFPDTPEYALDTSLRVGDEVSFTATEGIRTNFNAIAISAGTDFTVDSSGNSVEVRDRTGMDLNLEDDIYKIVRIQGTISNEFACGSLRCFELAHGDKVVEYRSDSQFDEEGDCLTYVGPVGSFPGFFGGDDPAAQLWARNFTWARGPFKD